MNESPVSSKCQRCNKEAIFTMMSIFNTEMICDVCQQKERQHPMFQKARQAEQDAISKGDYNYPGIGLPGDLR